MTHDALISGFCSLVLPPWRHPALAVAGYFNQMEMDILWAPWRINYIKNAKKQKGCLFCRVSKQSLNKDKANLVIFRSKYAFSVLNKYPYNNGHLMVSSYRHIRDLNQLKDDELLDFFLVIRRMQEALKKILRPDGFNLGINIGRVAGAGIPNHIHLHIVPRWKEDTNFMPAVSGVKVISQSLDKLYEELSNRLRR